MKISDLEVQIKILPESPGIYKFFDVNNNIIYIGKAINIKLSLFLNSIGL